MDGNSSLCEARYQLPAWFIKRKEAELAGTPDQMAFCASSCEFCKQSKGDDEDNSDHTRQCPVHNGKDTSGPQLCVSAQARLTNVIHHKTFVELRDTILANFVLEEDGRVGRPQDFGVIFRVKEGHRHVTEPTWVYQAGV